MLCCTFGYAFVIDFFQCSCLCDYYCYAVVGGKSYPAVVFHDSASFAFFRSPSMSRGDEGGAPCLEKKQLTLSLTVVRFSKKTVLFLFFLNSNCRFYSTVESVRCSLFTFCCGSPYTLAISLVANEVTSYCLAVVASIDSVAAVCLECACWFLNNA